MNVRMMLGRIAAAVALAGCVSRNELVMHMSNSISYSYRDLWMVAALVCVAVVLGIYPADRTVWCVEMVWAICSSGLFLWCVRSAGNRIGD